MHGIPAERFGDKVRGADTSTVERVQGDIAAMDAIWRNSGQPSAALELAFGWLKRHLQFADGRRTLNHCDLGCHNMLVKDGVLTALLDWETAVIGNPAYDLAYVYPVVVQMTAWEDFLAAYAQAGGVIPSAAELDFYRVWTTLVKLCRLFIARSFFYSGMSSSVVFAFAIQHLYQQIEHDLYQVLNELY
jgi:aminoglycoside phosphotransferase (APT) family kinase protein